MRGKNLSPAKEPVASFRKTPCVRIGIPAHRAPFQQRIAHNPEAKGMLAGDSGWYRAIQVIRIRTLFHGSNEPIHQPSQRIERTLHGRLSRIHRKDD
jgi:hypothetical protein